MTLYPSFIHPTNITFLGTRDTVAYKTEDKNLCQRAHFLMSDDKEDVAVLIMILNSLAFHLMQSGVKVYYFELGWARDRSEMMLCDFQG